MPILFGTAIAQVLRQCGHRVIGIDHNPELVRSGDAMKHPVMYGDAEDPDFIASLPYTRARWIVSTVHEIHSARRLPTVCGTWAIQSNCRNGAWPRRGYQTAAGRRAEKPAQINPGCAYGRDD